MKTKIKSFLLNRLLSLLIAAVIMGVWFSVSYTLFSLLGYEPLGNLLFFTITVVPYVVCLSTSLVFVLPIED